MTWKQWKKAIREALEAHPTFNIETDDIGYFDIVSGEQLQLTKHKTLTGVDSQARPAELDDPRPARGEDDE